jgi:hypothetical protein
MILKPPLKGWRMFKEFLLLTLLAGLSACAENQGRQTNCWSSNALSFAASDAPVTGCDWVEIGV